MRKATLACVIRRLPPIVGSLLFSLYMLFFFSGVVVVAIVRTGVERSKGRNRKRQCRCGTGKRWHAFCFFVPSNVDDQLLYVIVRLRWTVLWSSNTIRGGDSFVLFSLIVIFLSSLYLSFRIYIYHVPTLSSFSLYIVDYIMVMMTLSIWTVFTAMEVTSIIGGRIFDLLDVDAFQSHAIHLLLPRFFRKKNAVNPIKLYSSFRCLIFRSFCSVQL